MRRDFVVVLAVLFTLAGAAAPNARAQESQAAKTTRKNLQKTITIDLKEIGTKDFLEEISGELDGKVKFKINNGSGVSNNTKMTYSGKNVPVEKVLNDLADKYDWGWIVISNPSNNAIDGKVEIRKSTKGKERGYEAGKEPKKSSLERHFPNRELNREPSPATLTAVESPRTPLNAVLARRDDAGQSSSRR